MPALPDGKERTLAKQVTLDNNFSTRRYSCQMMFLCYLDAEFDPAGRYGKHNTLRIRTSIRFDSATFPLYHLEQEMARWEFGEMGQFQRLRWPFSEAIDNFKRTRWELKQRRDDAEPARNGAQDGAENKIVGTALPSVRRVVRQGGKPRS